MCYLSINRRIELMKDVVVRQLPLIFGTIKASSFYKITPCVSVWPHHSVSLFDDNSIAIAIGKSLRE